MEGIVKLLSLYQDNPKKFDKNIKKATKKNLTGRDVIITARDYLYKYEADLQSGALRPTRTKNDVFNLLGVLRCLIGVEIYRVWSGGRKGKSCSKVTVKSISIGENGIYLETQSDYSANFKEPIVRKVNLSDRNITWFLTEEECKEAIERM